MPVCEHFFNMKSCHTVVREASEGNWPTPGAEFGCGFGEHRRRGRFNRLNGSVICEPSPWKFWGRGCPPPSLGSSVSKETGCGIRSEVIRLGTSPSKMGSGIANHCLGRLWGENCPLLSERPHLSWASSILKD